MNTSLLESAKITGTNPETIVYQIKQNAAWSDGTPISADDFVYQWKVMHGESVKTVQRRQGHSSAAITLDTYAHLWPDADDRTREAVEQAFKVNASADNYADRRGIVNAFAQVRVSVPGPTGDTSASATCTASRVPEHHHPMPVAPTEVAALSSAPADGPTEPAMPTLPFGDSNGSA